VRIAAAAIAAIVPLAMAAVTPREARLAAIQRAQVWTATDVAKMRVIDGPGGPLAFSAGETVTCDFVEHAHGKGSTLKFDCRLPAGRTLKVRYGRTNGEVYAQVAATRLLWALGFGANQMYPVKIICRGCPDRPFTDPPPADRGRRVIFDPATIEERAAGTTIETTPDQGWSWRELSLVDEHAGGAPLRERDALRLLAILMQHSSNKAINQRLLCLDAPACRRTEMIIADVGKTFGRANLLNRDAEASVNFHAWSSIPVWSSATGCDGKLPWSLSGTLRQTRISEAGRAFLAERLDALTDQQLHDLFSVARFTERDPSATVDDWVRAFKAKRTEIASRHCE
jgi:hypothetical protein